MGVKEQAKKEVKFSIFLSSKRQKRRKSRRRPKGTQPIVLPLSSLARHSLPRLPRARAFETSVFALFFPAVRKWQTRWDTSRAAPRRRCRAASSASWRQSPSALLARSVSRPRPCLPPLRTFSFDLWRRMELRRREMKAWRIRKEGALVWSERARFRNFALA